MAREQGQTEWNLKDRHRSGIEKVYEILEHQMASHGSAGPLQGEIEFSQTLRRLYRRAYGDEL